MSSCLITLYIVLISQKKNKTISCVSRQLARQSLIRREKDVPLCFNQKSRQNFFLLEERKQSQIPV